MQYKIILQKKLNALEKLIRKHLSVQSHNKDTRIRCEMCSELKIKTHERRQ